MSVPDGKPMAVVQLMKTTPDESLQDLLTEHGISWEMIPWDRHTALEKEWESYYGNVWKLEMRHKHEDQARYEYAKESAADFLIVPFLGRFSGPHLIGRRQRHPAAYECHGTGTLPDLSSFDYLEFFVAPLDLAWTMVHTHEDYGYGGPYFIRKEWLIISPSRRQK